MAPYHIFPSWLWRCISPGRRQPGSEHVRVCGAQLSSILRLFDVQLQLHVVDGDPTYLEALQQILRSSVSLCITRFETGEQYMDYLQAQRLSRHDLYAALISLRFDRGDTPTMHGLEVLEALAGRRPAITSIMLAQGDEFQFSSSAMQHGAAAIVPRNAMTAMQIASVILFVISQSRIAIRRLQLRNSLIAFGIALLLLVVALLL